MPLPNHAAIACRDILMRCPDFEDYKSLLVLFTISDQLYPFARELPIAPSRSALVDHCMALGLERHSEDGQSVLLILIRTLHDKYAKSNPELQNDLHGVLTQLHPLIPKRTPTNTNCYKDRLHTDHALFKMLPNIDFHDQVQLVRQVLRHSSIGSFYIQGNGEFALQPLVYRLVRLSQSSQNPHFIIIDVASYTMSTLWRRVMGYLNIDRNFDLSTQHIEVINKICQWRQTEDVFLIFHSVNTMSTFLPLWLEKFWQPLVQAAQSPRLGLFTQKRLLMFLIDYSNNDGILGIQGVYGPEASYDPAVPLRVPPVGRFTFQMLDNWINGVGAELVPMSMTAEVLLEETQNGTPYEVYEKICQACGLSWEGDIAQWLTLGLR